MNKLSKVENVLTMLLAIFICSGSVYAEVSREYKLKAAYLLNFAKFIYWPDQVVDAVGDFNICVIGNSPFGDVLDNLSNKKIINKNIKIKYSEVYIESNQCRIVYVSQDKVKTYKDVLSEAGKEVVLTVSDIKGFCQTGGMIEFVRVGNKIKFEINLKQSVKSDIKYKSQLLEVAKKLR